jgi:hypothetical protein
MGGQDGYSRDLLSYNESSDSILAGIKIRPAARWNLGLDAAYTAAEAALDPFDLSADDYVATHPATSFDFSKTHTYSDLDMSRFNLDATLKFDVTEDLWLRLWYKLVDYTDDAPYLDDTSGKVQWASITAGWTF